MKKAIAIIFISIILIISTIYIFSRYANNNRSAINVQLLKHTKEELYQDSLVALLDPYIQKALINYYGKSYQYGPTVDILDITRPYGYRTYPIIIKLQVKPYVSAHNTIGIDNITFSIAPEKDVKIEGFEHIKSFELPQNLQ